MNGLEQMAIARLKTASDMSLMYYKQPLVITDSGGKDSSVCKELALRSGIPFETHALFARILAEYALRRLQ